MAGMKLDSDTLALYKFLETQPAESAQDTGTAGVKDASASSYDLFPVRDASAVSSRPAIVWGPQGNAVRTQFARYFFSNGNSQSMLRSATIDQNFVDAQRADNTWELYFKLDSLTGPNYPFSVADTVSVAVADDWLMSIQILANSDIRIFWEVNDADQEYHVSGSGITANTWHTIAISRREDPGDTTHYITRVFVDGVFIEEFDKLSTWVSGTGLRTLSTSGTNDHMVLGSGDSVSTGGDLAGSIAGIRCVELALTDTQIRNDHLDWVANGVLVFDNHGAGTTLCQYDLDEIPEFLDESPMGLHAQADTAGVSGGMSAYTGSDVCTKMDLIGTEGSSYHLDGGNILIPFQADPIAFTALHGREFHEFFNDAIDVPEWTVEFYGVFDSLALPGDWVVMQIGDAVGETLPNNWLTQVRIDSATLVGENFYERGTGTDINTATAGAVLTDNEQFGLMHIAIRQREDPGTPGNVLVDFFVNGVLRDTTATALPAQGGGAFDQNLRALGGRGYVQELKISKIAVTDAQILINSNAVGGTEPEILNVTPASGTSIDDDQVLEFDIIADVGLALAVSLIWFKYEDRLTYTVVYDGASFLPPFTGTVTDTIGDGSSLHFAIQADGRWRGDIQQMRVRTVGSNGFLDVEI